MRGFIFAFWMFVSSFSFAQNSETSDTVRLYQINQVTIVGERTKSIPGSGEYIPSVTLGRLNQSNINSVLRMVPGINIRDEEGFGLRPNIGLRGTSVNRSAKITLMEDGILAAPAPYTDPSAYYFPTFTRMYAVEVLKGSSQIMYGPYTIGGAVNLLSTPIPDSFRGLAQASHGSFGTNQYRIWLGDSRQTLDYVFEVNGFSSQGFKELDGGVNTGFVRRDIMGKIRWHSAPETRIQQSLTLKILNASETANETYLGLTFEDFKKNPNRRYAATQEDVLDLRHRSTSLTHVVQPIQGLNIQTTAYYTHTFRDWARVNTIGGQSINAILADPATQSLPYQIMTGAADGNIDHQSAARTYHTAGVQLKAGYVFTTHRLAHSLQVGFRYHTDEADRYATRSAYLMSGGVMSIVTAGIRGNQENQVRHARAQAAFAQYHMRLHKLKVSPGIRFEHIRFRLKNYGTSDNARRGESLQHAENDVMIFLPGIGITYDVIHSLTGFAGIHKGFSPPGMPALNPEAGQAKVETALNYEVGLHLSKASWRGQITGFLNDYDNILGSDNVSGGGFGTGDIFNAGNAVVKGLECSIGLDVLELMHHRASALKLPVQFAYTYTHATFRETFRNAGGDWGSGIIQAGDFMPFITPHLLSITISAEHNRWNMSMNARYVGLTRTRPGKGTTRIPSEAVSFQDVNAIGAYLIVDGSCNYECAKNITAFGTVSNLTNNRNIVANLPNGYRPNIPLSFNAGLKVVF